MINILKNILLEMYNSSEPNSPIALLKLNNAIENILIEQFGNCLFYDVSVLAKKLNITILYDNYDDCNDYYDNVSLPIIKYLRYYSSFSREHRKEIWIDKKVPICIKRYSIAYCIAKDFLSDELSESYTEYSIMELWHSSKEDLIKNNFALLLLHPMHTVCKLLEEFYYESSKSLRKRKTTEEWISFLANKCKSSEYHAANAYQLTRNILGMADVINDIELIKLRKKLNDIFKI